jgi:hypothetical protein
MPAPRVLVLYNEPTLPPDHPDAESEHDVLALADVVVRVLKLARSTVGRLGVVDSPEAVLTGVRSFGPDVVFNLYEGTAAWGNSEAYVAGLLELLRVPYTGSGPQAMILARSKPLTKALLTGAGIATAPYFVVAGGECPANPLGWPVIVKPAREDASVGIDQKSVCTTDAELADRVRHVQRLYGPGAVVERLIVGRELHAAVIETPAGLVPLPFTEIFFPPPGDGRPFWPIVTYDASGTGVRPRRLPGLRPHRLPRRRVRPAVRAGSEPQPVYRPRGRGRRVAHVLPDPVPEFPARSGPRGAPPGRPVRPRRRPDSRGPEPPPHPADPAGAGGSVGVTSTPASREEFGPGPLDSGGSGARI